MILRRSNTQNEHLTERYHLFMNWFKMHHPELFYKYSMHILIPGRDLRIAASLDYIDPEDKLEILKIISGYNDKSLV